MFPSQQNFDLRSQDTSIFQEDLANEKYIFADDQDLSVLAGNCCVSSPKDTKKRQRKTSSYNQENKEGARADNKGNKILHREFEKQRRKKMANLYASLRALLPLEYIKGKRAVSDHMNGAVNYIKDSQRNIQELCLRRDKLKRLSTSGSISADLPNNHVTVSRLRHGVEILINSSSKEGGFPLPRVLVELIRRKHNVVTSVSTRVNDRFLHRIQIEATVSDLTFIDLSSLQESLNNVINL
ncbi:unnamed protein product [Fraxinus pennsylvanica]|uniref:BHLH domain-containing protein n=1 Tax=Fraxinus pennsylvanica TaxID=56036 RepID=A0AAD1ZEU9_9LAMI|nr:unnamed protein product [Fraxinus pennsylvanica]